MVEIPVELTNLLSVLTPLILGIIGLRAEWSSKKAAKLKQLEQQEREREKTELNEKFDKLNSRLDQILADTGGIHLEIEALKAQNQSQDSAIQTIALTNRINGQYTHELAQLVTILAEGMRDQHLDGNVTRAIDAYRKFEARALGSMLLGRQEISEQ